MSEHAQKLNSIEPGSDSRLVIRKARMADVGDMYRIVNHYAETQLMLPKTELQLYENLRDYSVALDPDLPNRLTGCGALHIYWDNLAEIRALAIAPEMTGKGVGTALVRSLLAEARDMGIGQIFLFTYEPKFFSRFGFIQVEHNTLPLKVYNECFNCPKFNTCDELAMVLNI
jgi:amino-acid N-acetyltransferase